MIWDNGIVRAFDSNVFPGNTVTPHTTDMYKLWLWLIDASSDHNDLKIVYLLLAREKYLKKTYKILFHCNFM